MPVNFSPQVLTVLKLTIHKWADTPGLLRVAHISHVVPDTTCHFRDMRIKETVSSSSASSSSSSSSSSPPHSSPRPPPSPYSSHYSGVTVLAGP